MKTESRRKRRSAAQWQALVTTFEDSRLSCAEFAEREGLSAKTLYAWQRRLRVESATNTISKKAFAEVKVTSDEAPAQSIGLSLELGNYRVIHFSQVPPIGYLIQILGAL